MGIYVEPWAASYQGPYLAPPDPGAAPSGTPVEDGPTLLLRDPDRAGAGGDREPLAFVDGVRRGDATLAMEHPATGDVVWGVAGSHACGCVLVEPGSAPVFGESRIARLVIWGAGQAGGLPAHGGWVWRALSVPGDGPDDPLLGLQQRMRAAEQELARELFSRGYLTVLDGPLSRLHSLGGERLVGYVKTHHHRLLAEADHRRVALLGPGQRTSLFQLGPERYSCYLRLAPRPATAPPWAAVVRVEMPADGGLAAAARLADQLCLLLPRFAGVAHRDPRAPQNLQPVRALERHLRHVLGDPGLATRAVREAVASLDRAA